MAKHLQLILVNLFLRVICFYTLCFPFSVSEEYKHKNSSISFPDYDMANETEEVEPEITLQDLEERLKKLISGPFYQVYKYVYTARLPPDIPFSCLLNLALFHHGSSQLEPWAVEMLDSSGKLTDGLLGGTTSALGDYDECMDIVVGGKPHPRAYTGSYCLLEISPPQPIIKALKEYQANRGKGNISLAMSKSFFGFLRKVRSNPEHVKFRMGICMPSACDEEDVQDLIDMVAAKMNHLDILVKRCEAKSDHEYKTHEITIMVFLCQIIALSVVGTLIDIFYKRAGCINDVNSVLEPGPNALKLKSTWRTAKILEILSNFSLCSSTQQLLSCKMEADALDVIRGLKLLTVIFAIYTHTYALPHPLHLYRFRDTLNLAKFIDDVSFGTIANGSVGVDTIFFIAGFLFIYYRWRLLHKPPVFTYVLKFLGVSYLRMLAAQILIVFVFALFPLFGSGPLWHEFVEEPLENCANRWWYNVLFIQNFLGPYDSCLYQTWILATMMQLFVLTALIVWILHRKPAVGLSMTFIIIISAAIAVSIVTVVENYPPTFTVYFYDYRTTIKYFKYMYVQSYNHIGPFCIGMLVAYYLAENRPFKANKPTVLGLWLASCVTCCAIIFGLYHYREDREMNRGLAVFYSALHRPAWALAVGWVVYACATENGGFINSILSWKALIPLERLCYLAFLFHIPIMYYHGGVQRERMYMGHYNQVMLFFSYLVASFLVSFLCYLLFQYPYQTIEKYIFGINKESIWHVQKSAVSTETLKTITSEKQTEEDNTKVLYSRYDQSVPFSEVN